MASSMTLPYLMSEPARTMHPAIEQLTKAQGYNSNFIIGQLQQGLDDVCDSPEAAQMQIANPPIWGLDILLPETRITERIQNAAAQDVRDIIESERDAVTDCVTLGKKVLVANGYGITLGQLQYWLRELLVQPHTAVNIPFVIVLDDSYKLAAEYAVVPILREWIESTPLPEVEEAAPRRALPRGIGFASAEDDLESNPYQPSLSNVTGHVISDSAFAQGQLPESIGLVQQLGALYMELEQLQEAKGTIMQQLDILHGLG